MRLIEGAGRRAAFAATMVVFVALYPIWYGALMMYAHFPQLPPSLFLLYLLGLPGIYVAELLMPERLGSNLSFGDKLAVASVLAWIFYFAVFRLYFYWRSRHGEALVRSDEGAQERMEGL